jgi:putative endonuclease
MPRTYYVYILTKQRHTVLYTGVTNDLLRRVTEHREKRVPGFTARYNVDKLVYFEVHDDPGSAIEREKQIKNGPRRRKLELIDGQNPQWRDVYEDLLEE